MELLTQFPASNDEKYLYLWQINILITKLFDYMSFSHSDFSDILRWFDKRIYNAYSYTDV